MEPQGWPWLGFAVLLVVQLDCTCLQALSRASYYVFPRLPGNNDKQGAKPHALPRALCDLNASLCMSCPTLYSNQECSWKWLCTDSQLDLALFWPSVSSHERTRELRDAYSLKCGILSLEGLLGVMAAYKSCP